jgi:hypothetical protein
MILTPFGGLLMAAVRLAALQTEGFLTATEAAITLAAITVAAEIEHRPTGRKVTDPLAEDRGTSGRHRLREAAVDNRRRSWQDDSRLLEVLDQGHQQKAPVASHNRGFLAAFGNSSYQILLPPNAPAAMILQAQTASGDDVNSSHAGLCSKKYGLQCVLTTARSGWGNCCGVGHFTS